MGLNDSSLVTYSRQAATGNYTVGRTPSTKLVTEITIHHCAGVTTVEALGGIWATPGRGGSSHYGVHENSVGQYVCERDVAWTNDHWDSNNRAITIETSNSSVGGSWPVSSVTLNTLIKLVADIAKRHNLGKLVKGQNLTWHNMYVATECPGPHLSEKLQSIVEAANRINGY